MYSLKYTLKYLLIVYNTNTKISHFFWSMLIITVSFAQSAALICEIDVSCVTMLQIVY
jgi:hypothetical protein